MSGQSNIINDIGTLTKIPNKVLTELVHKTNLCIGSIIADAKIAGDQVVIINLGIGTLSIDLLEMQCKFVPSRELKNTIKNCITSPVDPLELVLEKALTEKLIQLCNEVL